MTTAQLNRDISRLYKAIEKKRLSSDEKFTSYFQYIDNTAKPEFIRLYHADDKFQYMSRKSILIMFRLNIRHRFVAFHNFGINIEL